ncbi:exodeoxyribonuclease III [alpha proteobacterium Q-1]|nr:exodeoxyribonuclease III [alpha proteobacterium Q-1]
MKIASFNINGVKARLPRLLEWLEGCKADVVCLQELKSLDENFPRLEFEDRGWHLELHGQKGFNGVALLSRAPLHDVRRGLPGMEDDPQARYIEGRHDGVLVASIYLPNGNPAPGPKYDYKLDFMEHLRCHAAGLIASEQPVVLAGDYNVIPENSDCYDPRAWEGDALFLPQTRAAYNRIVHQGWTDAIRLHHPGTDCFTFWDYQRGSWEKDHGIRIDHCLLSPAAADRLSDAGIDRMERGREKASDHVPVWIVLS